MNMRFKLFMQLAALCSAFFLAPTAFAGKSQEQSLDKIVAIVDEGVITQSELNQAILTMKKQMMAANMPVPNDAALRKQALDQSINRKLQLQLAAQSNVRVTDAELNQAIDNIARSNNVTPADLYKQIAQEGLSESQYRKEIREEMTLQRVQQQELGAKVSVSPEEVKKFMRTAVPKQAAIKEYHVADILVALPDAPSEKDIATAQQQASDLLGKLRQGSADTAGAATNDLGWRDLSEMPSAFVNVVSGLKQNEFSSPIQTSNGFHVLHLLEARNSAAPAAPVLSEQQAAQMLYQRKMAEELKPWMMKLRSGAYINTKV